MSALAARRRPAVIDWARSGLMALTGSPSHAPAIPRSDVVSRIRAVMDDVESASKSAGRRVRPDLRVLTERAALMGLRRGGATSCNRTCRLLETRDGWIAVNLPRPCDRELLPAWIGSGADADYWPAIAQACRRRDSADLLELGTLLGLAVAAVGETPPTGPMASIRLYADRGPLGDRDWARHPPLVLDLSALWAGPLCGQFLAQAGARVIKIESASRPDSFRLSCPPIFDLLNASKESVVLEFTNSLDLDRLRTLLTRADGVIASARPRAFAQLGLGPSAIFELNSRLTWIAISAHGWSEPGCGRVGFGDDCAAAGGLLAWSADQRPMFLGDAIADPLTGVVAAASAINAIGLGLGAIIDVSMARVAAHVAAARIFEESEKGRVVRANGDWLIEIDGWRETIAEPQSRPIRGHAAAFGADTRRVMSEMQ